MQQMKKIRTIDFETTGFDKEQGARVCEAAFTDVALRKDGVAKIIEPENTQSQLFDPEQDMPPEVQAVHHIGSEELIGKPPSWKAFPWLMEGMEDGDAFAAHNADFERQFFGGGQHPWICTYKCALDVWPEAPKHSNQVLRYWLDLDADFVDASKASPAHRAGPDTYVTAYILARLLNMRTVEQLVDITRQPPKLHIVTFGKHKGQKWSDLPYDYLDWIANKSDMSDDIKHNARINMESARCGAN